MNLKDLMKDLSPENRERLLKGMRELDVFKLKMNSGAVSPLERASYLNQICLGLLLRADLWEGRGFERAAFASQVYQMASILGEYKFSETYTKTAKDLGMDDNDDYVLSNMLVGVGISHALERYTALKDAMKPEIERLYATIDKEESK